METALDALEDAPPSAASDPAIRSCSLRPSLPLIIPQSPSSDLLSLVDADLYSPTSAEKLSLQQKRRTLCKAPHSCFGRSRSTSSSSSTTSSSRSVRFAQDVPKIQYTWPKEVYDRAPIVVDGDLRMKRCRTQETEDPTEQGYLAEAGDVTKPRTWVVDCYSHFVNSNSSSVFDPQEGQDAVDDDNDDAKTIKIKMDNHRTNEDTPVKGEHPNQSSHDVLLHLGFGADDSDDEEGEIDSDDEGYQQEGSEADTAGSDDESCPYTYHSASSSGESSPVCTPAASPASSPDYCSLPQFVSVQSPTQFVFNPSEEEIIINPKQHQETQPTFQRWDDASTEDNVFLCSPSASSDEGERCPTLSHADVSPSLAQKPKCKISQEERRKRLNERLRKLREMNGSQQEETFTCLGGF